MRLGRKLSIFCALLLFLLSGCASTSTQGSAIHAGATPKPTFFPTPTASSRVPTSTPTARVTSFQPNDHDPFQANFVENAPIVACPPSSRPTVWCFNVTGVGPSLPYGMISFHSFDINFQATDTRGCQPTTRQGSISIGKDTVLFTASGTWCVPLVHFVYQVSGGTGKFQHARGKGTIAIPDPYHNVLEYWTGTLTP